jgi:hypothetical protein
MHIHENQARAGQGTPFVYLSWIGRLSCIIIQLTPRAQPRQRLQHCRAAQWWPAEHRAMLNLSIILCTSIPGHDAHLRDVVQSSCTITFNVQHLAAQGATHSKQICLQQ